MAACARQGRETLIDAAAEAGAATRIRPATGDLQVTRAEEKLRRTDAMAAMLHRYDPATYQLPEAAREYRGMELLEIAREAWSARDTGPRLVAPEDRAACPGSGHPGRDVDHQRLLLVAGRSRQQDAARRLPAVAAHLHGLGSLHHRRRFQVDQPHPAWRGAEAEKVNEHGRITLRRHRRGQGDLPPRQMGPRAGPHLGDHRQRRPRRHDEDPALFGSAAANLESDIVYSILLANAAMADGTALFDNNHGNTGTGAIDVTNVGAGRAKMRLQKGLDGVTLLNIAPRYMLVLRPRKRRPSSCSPA